MSLDWKVNWKADDSVEGSTILDGVKVSHDKLIPEILRREAETLILALDEPRKDSPM